MKFCWLGAKSLKLLELPPPDNDFSSFNGLLIQTVDLWVLFGVKNVITLFEWT